MPLHQAIGAFAAAFLLALLAARFEPRLRGDLTRPASWLALAALAALASAMSGLAARTGHAGTGFVTRHGWPKPFLFENLRETGERFTTFEPLYFAGNMLAHAAILLLAWTAFRAVRPGRG